MMNPDVKVKWLTALRSGEYEQGRFQLRTPQGPDDTRYCCLGVLTCLAEAEGVPESPENPFWTLFPDMKESRKMLSPIVQEWAELIAGDAGVPACMNDAGKSFYDIADYIEEKL